MKKTGRQAAVHTVMEALDMGLRQTAGITLAELASDFVQSLVGSPGRQTVDSPGVPDSPVLAASRVLGVRPDAHPDVIEAARRVLLRNVKGGEEAIGGDEQRAKQINAAADTLLGKRAP